jgi:hypothetical protein
MHIDRGKEPGSNNTEHVKRIILTELALHCININRNLLCEKLAGTLVKAFYNVT